MTTLTSKTPGTPDFTYLGLLHLEANTQITSLLQKIQDGGGNDTGLEVSTTALKYTGNLTLASLTANTIVYLDTNKKLVSLAAGSTGDVLTLAGGVPTWSAPASGITIGTTPITGGGSGRILFESATGKVSEDSNLTFISQQLTVNGQLNLGTGSIPANTGVNNELQKYYSERVYKYNIALTILHKNNTFEMEFGSYDGDYYWYGVNSSFTGYSWGGNLNQQLFRIERTGNVGVNIYSPQARFHIIDTAEQLRIGYDGSNYLKVTVGSTGLVTYDAVGSGAGFKFMKPINLQNIPTSSAGLSSGDIWNDSGTLKIV